MDKEKIKKAVLTAESCSDYSDDYEEELCDDENISCLNCRYRRWIKGGFECVKGKYSDE
ncbi:MAG: hypothetical protein K6F09_07615 [Clostridiales bacterium]|nr:hypothetical protein [Clostridiales bacterium]